MLCSIFNVLLIYCLYVLSTSLLCPSRISYPRCKYFVYFALVECWTCNWSLGLFLTALHVWMSIYLLNVHCGHSLMTVFIWSRYAYMFSMFTNLITLYLLMYIPCVQLVISLMKVLFVCKCYRLQVFTCKCFIASRLCVSEFCLYSQTHIQVKSLF